MNRVDLLILQDELQNDPLSLGLTTLPADDEANANILNVERESIQVFRASIPSDTLSIPMDEWNALSPGQQSWWSMQTADGSISPAVIEDDFFLMFGPATLARVNWETATKETASRGRQLLARHVTITPSDIADARVVVP